MSKVSNDNYGVIHLEKPGSSKLVIPSKEGIQELYTLDSRLRGNDSYDHSVIPVKTGIQ
ncbi:MAG: hypothetical protein SFT93_01075 [Rickettsiaceae bacterium]|nr:hypothetical protein [Rickettsiaceae bacterium]